MSLKGADAVVVAPIFGLRDEVVGALYGLRNPRFQFGFTIKFQDQALADLPEVEVEVVL